MIMMPMMNILVMMVIIMNMVLMIITSDQIKEMQEICASEYDVQGHSS